MANGSRTSSFGTVARMNHDSSKFYGSKLYKELGSKQKTQFEKENGVLKKNLNKIFCSSSEKMKELPNNSIHIMVTSPPYNVGKDYDEDLTLKEYLRMLKNVFKETHRVLITGRRTCINVANIGRKPYIPLNSHINHIMLDLGFLMRGEIIWDKSSSAGVSTAWGTWKSAKNPVLRDVHEYILVFSKDSFMRDSSGRRDTVTKDDFLQNSKSVWSFPAVSARKIGHPAPFPLELPHRLIQLYTFENDVILDPFMGSGQTALAAVKINRNYVGYDINAAYCKLAKDRIKKETSQKTLHTHSFQ